MLCVLLCFRRLSAHSLLLVVAGCLGPCLCTPVLGSLVRSRGLAFRLVVCLLGFPAVVCAVKPFPTISSLCNLRQRSDVVSTQEVCVQLNSDGPCLRRDEPLMTVVKLRKNRLKTKFPFFSFLRGCGGNRLVVRTNKLFIA